ncbi:hypothetical protein Z042_14280 [Chania multitudinisentens RB-25]|uniref:Uncharacterized protein n=1 Tax=Chania multitudinisentens RB-25 TaxID=1441930 RepID=W0LLC0_9GAMM|nr:hypothetical protein [Chania multitudinisentens]AHG22810.1 hypothetical protein Z042_14280 [Chania multitudinisentens RB-25]
MTDKFEIGDYCIHTSKWGKTGCIVAGYYEGAIIIKKLGSGFVGVPAKSLTKCTEAEAKRLAQAKFQLAVYHREHNSVNG